MRFWLLLCLLLTGCVSNRLIVVNEYVTETDLASYHVQSPDPSLVEPDLGQRLTVYWKIPHLEFPSTEQAQLVLDIRFVDGEEVQVTHPVDHHRGHFIYELMNKSYFERQGIRTYRARILAGDEVLAVWLHQVWASRITVGEE